MLFSQYLDMMDSACKGTTLFLYDKILAQKIAAELRSCPSVVLCTCGAVQCSRAAFIVSHGYHGSHRNIFIIKLPIEKAKRSDH